MKLLLHPNDTLTNKISFYQLVAFVVALPFDQFYSELALVSFLLHTLITLKKEDLRNILTKEVLLLVSVFLLTVVGALYTTNKTEALKLLSRQLAILLFPVLLFINPIALKKYKRPLLLSFSVSFTLAVVYLFADALRIIRYHHLPLSALLTPAFQNHHFSEPIDLHATYFSLYMALALAVFLNCFRLEKKTTNKIFFATATGLLGLGLLQSGSKAVLAGVLLTLLAFPFFLDGKRKRFFTVGAALAIAGTLLSIFTVPSFRYRFVNLLREDLSETAAELSIADPRLQRWELAFDLVKKAPLTGYGSGDEVDLLKETYYNHKLYDSYLHRLNAHNQYLSFLLMGGVGALAVYLLTIFYGLRFAIRQRSFVFLSFVLLLLTVSVSENILFRNKGIFFYSFFFTLFVGAGKTKRKATVLPQESVTTGNPERRILVSTFKI